MNEPLRSALDQFASDAESGASELLPRSVDLLRRARPGGRTAVLETARAVCAAQPSMAPVWNAAAAALRDLDDPGALERFEYRIKRAGPAMQRLAMEILADGAASRAEGRGGAPARETRFTTYSYSASVLAALVGVASSTTLHVACAEGRPRFEGRRLAVALARAGVHVTLYTDAAVGASLRGAQALLLGADAVAPGWFLNKCGTLPLAIAASSSGVPVYVLAARDKFVPLALVDFLSVNDHAGVEVWEDAPPGVAVRNPYFERVPLHWITGIVTDAGLMGADMAEEACRANGAGLTEDIVDSLRPSM